MFQWKEVPQSLIIKKLPFYLEGSEGSILLPLLSCIHIYKMLKCDANFINQLYFQVNHCARVTFLLKKKRDN